MTGRRLVALLAFGAHFALATALKRGLLASFRHQQSHTPSNEFNASQQVAFYPHPAHNRFQALGEKYNTDKVGRRHNYQTVYGRAFEQCNSAKIAAGAPFKLLEIGLGCNMQYGPGHSGQVWREYIPQAEVWFGEYDYECVQRYKSDLEALGLAGVVTGDQADIETLQSWVASTGGGFDLIVDDGGHTNMQLYNSFAVLFQQALKPGGLYVMEDIMTCRTPTYRDGDGRHITLDIIKDWMDDLVMSKLHRKNVKTLASSSPSSSPSSSSSSHPSSSSAASASASASGAAGGGGGALTWRRPPRVKSIECSSHYCAFTKCFDDDEWCNAIEEETQPLHPHDPNAPASAAAVTEAAAAAGGATGGGRDQQEQHALKAMGAKAAGRPAPARAVVFKRGGGSSSAAAAAAAAAGGGGGAVGEGQEAADQAAAAKRAIRSKRRRAESAEVQEAAAEEEGGAGRGRGLMQEAQGDADAAGLEVGLGLGLGLAGGGVEQRVEQQQQQQQQQRGTGYGGISGVRSGMLWRHHGMRGR